MNILNTEFEQARLKYKPDKIKYLLVAESPPEIEKKRFFYFEKVKIQDSLFLQTMKVLYPNHIVDVSTLRSNKSALLKRFQCDGFYLIDALDMPIGVKKTKHKINKISDNLCQLEQKIIKLVHQETKIILISKPVYEAAYEYLFSKKLNVVNKEIIPFPGSGWQCDYRIKLMYALGIVQDGEYLVSK